MAMRVHEETMESRERASKTYECLECGTKFTKTVGPRAAGKAIEFCSTSCRSAWHNTRKTRGALLYDLMMTNRLDRQTAEEMGLYTIICRQISNWRDEDERHRGGRRSYRKIRDVFDDFPGLRAIRMDVSFKKRR